MSLDKTVKSHDAVIGRIFNEVAEELDVEPSLVRELYMEYMDYVCAAMGDDQMPTIRIPYLGEFLPSIKLLDLKLKKDCVNWNGLMFKVVKMAKAINRLRSERLERLQNSQIEFSGVRFNRKKQKK